MSNVVSLALFWLSTNLGFVCSDTLGALWVVLRPILAETLPLHLFRIPNGKLLGECRCFAI